MRFLVIAVILTLAGCGAGTTYNSAPVDNSVTTYPTTNTTTTTSTTTTITNSFNQYSGH